MRLECLTYVEDELDDAIANIEQEIEIAELEQEIEIAEIEQQIERYDLRNFQLMREVILQKFANVDIINLENIVDMLIENIRRIVAVEHALINIITELIITCNCTLPGLVQLLRRINVLYRIVVR